MNISYSLCRDKHKHIQPYRKRNDWKTVRDFTKVSLLQDKVTGVKQTALFQITKLKNDLRYQFAFL